MVDIIPKEVPKPSKILNFFFYLAIFLLIFSLAGYFILNNFLDRTDRELNALKTELAEIMTEERSALEDEILKAKSKIDKFSLLISGRLVSQPIFEIIENVTHPQVWFRTFDFNIGQAELALSGETQSFITLWQQILILRDNEQINNVNLDNFLINQEGLISFDLSLSLKPDIFK